MKVSGKLYWGTVALTCLIYAVMLTLPFLLIPGDMGGSPPFDLRPTGYTLEEAQAFLGAISIEARAYYVNEQRWLDTAFPALFCVSLILTVLRYYHGPVWRCAALLAAPVLAACFDFLENAAVAAMLRAPEVTTALVETASIYTQAKFVAIAVASLSILMMLALQFFQRRVAR